MQLTGVMSGSSSTLILQSWYSSRLTPFWKFMTPNFWLTSTLLALRQWYELPIPLLLWSCFLLLFLLLSLTLDPIILDSLPGLSVRAWRCCSHNRNAAKLFLNCSSFSL